MSDEEILEDLVGDEDGDGEVVEFPSIGVEEFGDDDTKKKKKKKKSGGFQSMGKRYINEKGNELF